jgi:uncharacterized protein DUF4333
MRALPLTPALVAIALGSACGGASAPSGAPDAATSAARGSTASPTPRSGSSLAGGIDTAKAGTAARRLVAAQTGADVVSVSCPRESSIRVGADFSCTATGADGTTAPVVMTTEDAAGDVALRALDLLQTSSAAKLIADALTHEYKASVTVQCPDLVSAHKNTTMTCHATDAGVLHNVVVTVKDDQGSLAYRLEK